MEQFPVVQRRPVAFGDFNADQLGTVAVGHPGTVANPVVRHAIDFALGQSFKIYFQQSAVVLNVVKGFVVRRQETTKGVVASAFGQLYGFGVRHIQ